MNAPVPWSFCCTSSIPEESSAAMSSTLNAQSVSFAHPGGQHMSLSMHAWIVCVGLVHTPPEHVVPIVQPLPSSHAAPLFAGAPPVHWPPLHVSPEVQRLPSSHATPLLPGAVVHFF